MGVSLSLKQKLEELRAFPAEDLTQGHAETQHATRLLKLVSDFYQASEEAGLGKLIERQAERFVKEIQAFDGAIQDMPRVFENVLDRIFENLRARSPKFRIPPLKQIADRLTFLAESAFDPPLRFEDLRRVAAVDDATLTLESLDKKKSKMQVTLGTESKVTYHGVSQGGAQPTLGYLADVQTEANVAKRVTFLDPAGHGRAVRRIILTAAGFNLAEISHPIRNSDLKASKALNTASKFLYRVFRLDIFALTGKPTHSDKEPDLVGKVVDIEHHGPKTILWLSKSTEVQMVDETAKLFSAVGKEEAGIRTGYYADIWFQKGAKEKTPALIHFRGQKLGNWRRKFSEAKRRVISESSAEQLRSLWEILSPVWTPGCSCLGEAVFLRLSEAMRHLEFLGKEPRFFEYWEHSGLTNIKNKLEHFQQYRETYGYYLIHTCHRANLPGSNPADFHMHPFEEVQKLSASELISQRLCHDFPQKLDAIRKAAEDIHCKAEEQAPRESLPIETIQRESDRPAVDGADVEAEQHVGEPLPLETMQGESEKPPGFDSSVPREFYSGKQEEAGIRGNNKQLGFAIHPTDTTIKPTHSRYLHDQVKKKVVWVRGVDQDLELFCKYEIRFREAKAKLEQHKKERRKQMSSGKDKTGTARNQITKEEKEKKSDSE